MTFALVSPSLIDLSNEDNIVQARHELHRALDARGDVGLAAWARKWGEAALSAAGDTADQVGLDVGVEADEYTDTLQDAANDAVAAVDRLLLEAANDVPSEFAAGVRNAIADLRAAL